MKSSDCQEQETLLSWRSDLAEMAAAGICPLQPCGELRGELGKSFDLRRSRRLRWSVTFSWPWERRRALGVS